MLGRWILLIPSTCRPEGLQAVATRGHAVCLKSLPRSHEEIWPAQTLCGALLQDLLVPFVHKPKAYRQSPLQGAPPRERTILLFFRGDVGKYRRGSCQ